MIIHIALYRWIQGTTQETIKETLKQDKLLKIIEEDDSSNEK